MGSEKLDYKKTKKIITTILILIVAWIFFIEVADNIMLYITRSQGYGPDTLVEKLFRYLFITTLFNLCCVVVPIIINKALHFSYEKQCTSFLVGLSFVSCNVMYSHYQFSISYGIVVLPVIVAILIESRKLLKFIIGFNFFGLALGVFMRAKDPLYNKDIIPEAIIALCIFVAYSIFARMIIKVLNKSRKDLSEALVLAEQAKYIEELDRANTALEAERDKLRTISEETFTALSNAVDFNDHYTNGHSKRVAMYSSEMAKRLGFSAERQREVYYAGLLHDVGKIGIENEIINKNGRLTDDEFEQIKMHPSMGFQILRSISSQGEFAAGAKWHHERYDGKGYPDGLSGDKIPEIARIIAVADSYDAMTSKRSYRNVMSQDKVREQIEQGKGTQFDPFYADIMLQMIDEDKDYTLRQDTDRRYNIIVVDDDVTCIDQIRGILKNERYNVIGATTFETGMNIINTVIPDLVLMDMVLPDMTGFEGYRRIRSEGKSVPICFISGNNDIELMERAKTIGALAYFVKPLQAPELKEVLHAIFLDV